MFPATTSSRFEMSGAYRHVDPLSVMQVQNGGWEAWPLFRPIWRDTPRARAFALGLSLVYP